MKNYTKIFSLIIVLTIAVLIGCKKDKDDQPSSGSTHKVVYKATGSAGVNIGIAVAGTDGKTGTETFSSLTGSTWTSKEYVFPAGALVAQVRVNAIGPEAGSTLNVQVWIDGEMKAQGNSTGTALTAGADYYFK